MTNDPPQFYRPDDDNALSGKTVVHDEYGIRYVLTAPLWKSNNSEGAVPLRPLAEGGQGATYLTENPNVILKFAKRAGSFITEQNEIEEYKRRIYYISTLPLPPFSNITIPETFIREYAGYRMIFLDGLCSVDDFFMRGTRPDTESCPTYIEDSKSGNRLWNYLLTGALAHRLAILGKAAIILARLHVHGISYGDISLNNIFLPRNRDESDVWFIDPDNMVEEGNQQWSQSIGTDPYCSPEVCENECCTLATDTFSFAELAFHLLADRHPFHGKAYDESDLFVEEKNNPRFFAWICDPEDESNHSELFLPAKKIFSSELMKLFWQTFVAGKENPDIRSPMSLWPTCFFQELDALRQCPNCKMSFITIEDDADIACPVCKASLEDYILFTIYSLNGNQVLWRIRNRIALDNTASGSIQRRAIAPFEFDNYDENMFRYTLEDNQITFQKLHMSNYRLFFYASGGQSQELGAERFPFSLEELQSGCFISEIQKFGFTISRKIVCRIIRRRMRQ